MPERDADPKAQGGRSRDWGAQHPIEWVVGGISAILITALLGYLLYSAFAAGDRPPNFTHTIDRVDQHGDAFHVAVAVLNSGDTTAADVVLRGVLFRPGQAPEVSETQFDYVPARSTRRGTLIFRSDPRAGGRLEIEVASYTDP